MSELYGPTLPTSSTIEPSNYTNDEDNTKGCIIGPVLPPNLSLPTEEVSSSTYGPALPPHLQKPSPENDSDDEDVFGPLPAGISSNSSVQRALEERALQIKLGHLNYGEEKGRVREEWMMELPTVGGAKLGVGPRQFRKNEMPDFSDRSSWTDTPEKKAEKLSGKNVPQADLKKEAAQREIDKRDEEQARLSERHKRKKRKEKSLLEQHRDKLSKQKKKEEEGTTTRRPFSREIDLQVNRFDDAQKKAIIKKAMHLDDRFSRGQSKFL